MASQNPVHVLRPQPRPHRHGSSYEPLHYHSRYPELTPVQSVQDEPRLGPYETRYLIEMGYATPPRNVG